MSFDKLPPYRFKKRSSIIAEQIVNKIRSGEYPKGSKLPPERAIAEHLYGLRLSSKNFSFRSELKVFYHSVFLAGTLTGDLVGLSIVFDLESQRITRLHQTSIEPNRLSGRSTGKRLADIGRH
jgi:hypothetical protein